MDLPRPDRRLPFVAPWILAPMEGVTDPAFRDVMLALHGPEDLGGVFTEFVRVVARPVPSAILSAHLGTTRGPIPVGIQLMGTHVASVAETASRAEAAGAPVVDLNFGCPAKGALRGCAGSAALKDPRSMESLVRACVDAVERIPVTAKIRAGYDDASRVEELARAVENGGASLLTIHCRTRAEGYQDSVDWSRIARAVAAVSIPVCGNGSVLTHADLERMRRETGCRFVMVGRAALADPWIFSDTRIDAGTAFRFLHRYAQRMVAASGTPLGVAGRVKQLIRYWTAGGAFATDRQSWLRDPDPEHFLARLEARAGASP